MTDPILTIASTGAHLGRTSKGGGASVEDKWTDCCVWQVVILDLGGG